MNRQVKKMKETNENTIPLTTRLPADLHKCLRFIAADEGRSLNAALIQLLREAVEGRRISVPSGLLSHEQTP